MLSHSIANRYTLSACSDRVCCVLDIGACDDSTARQKQSATNAEVGVRAFEMSVSFYTYRKPYSSFSYRELCRSDFTSKQTQTYSKLLPLPQRMTLREDRLRCPRGRESKQCLDVSDRAW
jgi:hypothetical protein